MTSQFHVRGDINVTINDRGPKAMRLARQATKLMIDVITDQADSRPQRKSLRPYLD